MIRVSLRDQVKEGTRLLVMSEEKCPAREAGAGGGEWMSEILFYIFIALLLLVLGGLFLLFETLSDVQLEYKSIKRLLELHSQTLAHLVARSQANQGPSKRV